MTAHTLLKKLTMVIFIHNTHLTLLTMPHPLQHIPLTIETIPPPPFNKLPLLNAIRVPDPRVKELRHQKGHNKPTQHEHIDNRKSECLVWTILRLALVLVVVAQEVDACGVGDGAEGEAEETAVAVRV